MSKAQYPASEGLQVLATSTEPQDGPEVIHPNEAKYIVVKEGRYGENAERRVLGMKRFTFWIMFTLLVLVIAAAVGSGAAVASKHAHKAAEAEIAPPVSSSPSSSSSSSSSTSAPSTTSQTSFSSSSASLTAATPFPTSGILSIDCPAIDNTTYISTPAGSSKSFAFQIHCGMNYNTGGVDLVKTKTLTFESCIDLCAEQNDGLESPCASLVWNANLTLALGVTGGNCWLKNNANDPEPGPLAGTEAAALWVKGA